MRRNRLDVGQGHGPHLPPLADLQLAGPEPLDGGEGLVDRYGDQLLGRHPLEDVLDAGHMLVHGRAGERASDLHAVGIPLLLPELAGDEAAAERLQSDGPELLDRHPAVELPQRAEGLPDVVHGRGGGAVRFAVALLRPPQVPQHDVGNSESGGGRRAWRQLTALGFPLGEEPVIPLAAVGGAVSAEVDVLPAEGDDGLSGGFVEPVGGGFLRGMGCS